MNLSAPVVPMHEVALIDEAAVELGQDLGELMERAGTALANEAHAIARERSGPVLIVTGGGNNGGDGWVAARRLAKLGCEVMVWPVLEPRTQLCRQNAERATKYITTIDAAPAEAPALIIDAILGAGAEGEPHGAVANAITALRALDCPILAADVPTGIGTDQLLTPDVVVTFQVGKYELLSLGDSVTIKVVDIGIDPAAWRDIHRTVIRRFPFHHLDAHKGQHGELLVVGGGAFPGALEFSCRAALRTGCDLVQAYTGNGPPLPAAIITHRQSGRLLRPTEESAITPLLARASAILIGPGFGQHEEARAAAEQVFDLALDLGVPTVVDADGITLLSPRLRDMPPSDTPVIITPHLNEARSLLGEAPEEDVVHAFAREDRVILLKRRVDFITNGHRWQYNPRGNPRMAMGGTGDCLAGITAGLLARGCDPFDAARLAVFWLTTAADDLWNNEGPCYLVDDVLANLGRTLHRHLDHYSLWPPAE